MREIVLDTETTGLDPSSGHRVVEIGCIELVNHMPTGREFHFYVNPERDMPSEAEAVHGLSAAFLSDKPLFSSLADDLMGFIGDAPIIAHNAGFDVGFLNAELRRAGKAPLTSDRTIDTVMLARRKFPGAQASLDALCRRFQIDLSERGKHGALLDAKLLAKVYLELVGGREPGLALASGEPAATSTVAEPQVRIARPPRPHQASADEQAAHAAFITKLKNPIWLQAADPAA
jgi:DNA polymerase-3 subunit epsilon